MKLLIVDDSGFSRRKFREAILKEEPSLDIVEAMDGVDALQKIESEAPDVCVSDLLMPKMSGLDFLRAMKERAPTIKIIVLSADIQDRRKEECNLHYVQNGEKQQSVRQEAPADDKLRISPDI